MDKHTSNQRSYNMSQIKSKDTSIEKLFRHKLWSEGIRGYKINYKIEGRPDIFFTKQKIAIFIDGCFWHKCPDHFIKPKTRNDYWDQKIKRNVENDLINSRLLQNKGIYVIRIWEHAILKNIDIAFKSFLEIYESKKNN